MEVFMKKAKLGWYVLSFFLLFFTPAEWVSAAPSGEGIPAEWMETYLEILARGSSQVILVTGDDSSGFHATLHFLEKRGGAWHGATTPLRALIGGKGFAPPGAKREGDVRTPSGVFALKRTFGYAPEISSRMPYSQVGKDDLWVDDVSSPDYNRWVKRGRTSASSFEVMKLDDDRYKYGIIIEYNTDPVVRGAGSAIFIHVRRGENMPTLGCVALSEEDIRTLLAWLDPAAKPLVVLGTRDSLLLPVRSAGRDQAVRRTGVDETKAEPLSEPLPNGFVYVDELIPDLRVELRYATARNFVGERIDGYLARRPILTREAAIALRRVQEELRRFGLGLKLFDAYRPQRAVNHFVRWASDLKDTRMKGEFYPKVRKEDLFRDDYIAHKSGHSRGSTVDLTIAPLGDAAARELDMGSGFDFFGPESWPEYRAISTEQRAHRLLLQTIMKKFGFKRVSQGVVALYAGKRTVSRHLFQFSRQMT